MEAVQNPALLFLKYASTIITIVEAVATMQTRKRSHVTPSPSIRSHARKRGDETVDNIKSIVGSDCYTLEEKIIKVLQAMFKRMIEGVWFWSLEENDKNRPYL